MVFQTEKSLIWVYLKIQEERLDYIETFAPIVKLMSYKYLFAIRVKRSYWIRYIDVVIAFLYGFFDEVVYIKQFHLFFIESNKICKLIKVLYRLKQVSHVLYKTLVKFFKKLGFIQLKLDYEIIMSTNKHLFIAIYVNNLLIFGLDVAYQKDV